MAGTPEQLKYLRKVEERYGLPEGFLYKIWGVESSYGKHMKSPAGAEGHFQFMPATAKAYGLKNPYDFFESAEASGRFFGDLFKQYNGNAGAAIAHYNGGGKAAKAYLEGNPWEATVEYLKRMNMAVPKNMTAPTLSSSRLQNFTQGDVAQNQTYMATPQYMLEQYKNLPFSSKVWESAKSIFTTNNSVYNYFVTEGMKEYDPDFSWTQENMDRYLKDIPEGQQSYILNSMSANEADRRRQAVVNHLFEVQKMQQLGTGANLVGGLLESFLEPETYLFMLPIFNGGALAYQSSRVGRMLMGGVTGGLQNLAVDAVMGKYKPSFEPSDLYMSALTGLGFGMLGGAFTKAMPDALKPILKEQALNVTKTVHREYSKEVLTKLRKMGYGFYDYSHIDIKSPDSLSRVLGSSFAPMDYSKRSFAYNQLLSELQNDVLVLQKKRRITEFQTNLLKEKLDGFKGEKAKRTSALEAIRKEEAKAVKAKEVADKEAQLKPLLEPKKIDTTIGSWSAGEAKGLTLPNFSKPSVSTLETLALIAKRSKDPTTRAWAERLIEHLGEHDIPLFFGNSREIGKGKAGRFSASNYIAVYKTSKMPRNDDTILHEVEHALSFWKLEYGKNNPYSGHGRIYTELEKCFNIAKMEAEKQGFTEKDFYGLKDIHEFCSTLLENKDEKKWIDFLSSIKLSDGTTLWSRFVRYMQQLLGFSDDSLYARAIGLTDELNKRKLDLRSTDLRTGKMVVERYKEMPNTAVQDPSIAESGSSIDKVDMLAKEHRTEATDIFGIGLDLQHAVNGKDVPSAVKGLFAQLIGTNVGTKGHTVVRESVGEMKTRLSETLSTKALRQITPAWESYLKKNNIKMKDKARAYESFNSLVDSCIRGIEGNYPDEVKQSAKAIREAYASMREYINNPELETGLKKRGLTEYEFKDPETGELLRIGELPENPNYAPRKYLSHKISALADDIGREGIIDYFQGAYLAHNPSVTEDFARRWAEWHLNTLERTQINNIHNDVSLGMEGFNFVALKESLTMNGFSESEALSVIRSMTNFSGGRPESRTSSNLKYRAAFDEKFTMDIRGKDGELRTVGIQDMIDTNAVNVMQGYLSRMSGAVSLARYLNVYKEADWKGAVDHAFREQLGSTNLSKAKKNSLRNKLQFGYDRIMDVPQEEFSVLSKSLNMFGKYNVIRLMGQASFNQVVEMSNILGTVGFSATTDAVSELGRVLRDAKTGKLNNEFLSAIEDMMGGSGLEFARQLNFSHNDWVENLGNTARNRFLDKVDGALDRGASNLLHYTGMTPLTTYQQKVFALSYFNKLMDIAHGVGDRSYFSSDRLHWMGLEESDFKGILSDMKKYTTARKGEKGAKSNMIDMDKWLKENPTSYHKLALAARRESRRVIQENDLASMIPIMGTTLGKTLFQFMNFSMQAWSKSMLFGLHHRDNATLASVLYGGTLACLTYVARTYGQSANMEENERREFLEARLSTRQIVANSFGRIQQASVIPSLFDTLSPWEAFSGMRTTSDVSSLASMPTVQLINSLVGMKKLISNGLSDEQQTTRREVRSMLRILPLNNTIPSMWLLNNWVNSFPTSEKEK